MARTDRYQSVSKSARFRLAKKATLTMAIHWRAPFTDGIRITLPREFEFVSRRDSSPEERLMELAPAALAEFESEHVPQEWLNDPKYAESLLPFLNGK